MAPKRILIQLDSDPQPSVFDAIVAIDAGAEQLLQYGAIDAAKVLPLVHGAMFTRGPEQLKSTAIFIGGSSVPRGEAIGQTLREAFFGPVRVSIMLDGNGANTTAAAAVLCAARHTELRSQRVIVLGGTGPVGGRVARLLVREGADVLLASRDPTRAKAACGYIQNQVEADAAGSLHALGTSDSTTLEPELQRANMIFACGAAGVPLLSEAHLQMAENAKVAIDLNAVPPAGITGIEPTDKAVQRGGRVDYGAIGVGGLKMKIHRAAIAKLFDSNDQYLDAEQIFDLGRALEANR
jgi:hypothetical protein